MIPVEKTYSSRFFKKRHSLAWRSIYICQAIKIAIRPLSVIDVGCAVGDLVAEFNRINIPAMGLEGSRGAEDFLMCPPELIQFLDLRERHFFSDWFHLATCFEVAEHIEPEYADIFVENLVCLSNQILMSAAPPGQDGHGHVNCQPIEYWNKKFSVFGYQRDERIEAIIKYHLMDWRHKPGIKAIYQNMVYYAR